MRKRYVILIIILFFFSKGHSEVKNVLIGLSGSIACYKTCSVISKLKQDGYDVRVVATASALNFIGTATLEGLSGHEVAMDIFANGRQMQHIDLAKWADILVICPATGDLINGMAAGLANDLLKSICLAYDFRNKPLIIFPAMNTVMYNNPITQKSLKKLSRLGIEVFETAEGHLACGDIGEGKLLDPEEICYRIKSIAERK